MAVDGDVETHRLTRRARPQHQMQVTGMEAIGQGAAGAFEMNALLLHGPLARQAPVVALHRPYRVGMRLVAHLAARRCKALGAEIAEIGFR